MKKILLSITILVLVSFLILSAITYSEHSKLTKLQLKDNTVYQLSFTPKWICLLYPYEYQFSHRLSYPNNVPEQEMSTRLNQYLQKMKFSRNQENQISIFFVNKNNIDGITINKINKFTISSKSQKEFIFEFTKDFNNKCFDLSPRIGQTIYFNIN